MRGTEFDLQLGFGMIRGEDGLELFFDQSDLIGTEISELAVGQRVEYDVEDRPAGPRPVNIKVLGGRHAAGRSTVGLKRANP